MSFKVAGLGQLQDMFDNLPSAIGAELTKQIEREAERLVTLMERDKPLGLDGAPIKEIQVGWTWGDVPKGAVSVGRVANKEYAKIGVTIYARGADGSGFGAAWFEFGTKPRTQKTTGKYTGVLPAQPFFWPSYRERRKNIRRNLKSALTRGLKKA